MMKASQRFELRVRYVGACIAGALLIMSLPSLIGGAAAVQLGFDFYVGRPVADLAARIGPPTSASLDRYGWTIFEWNRFGPTGQRIGASSTFEGHWLFTGRCVLRVVSEPARTAPTRGLADWIVADWRFVGGGCI